MRAGPLDRRIDIQRRTVTESGSGFQVEAWTNIVSRRPASYRPLKGEERFVNPQVVASEQVEFKIRYGSSVADLTPLDRIIYPALSADSPPTEVPKTSVYEILAVNELGRRDGFSIIAQRRADAING